jgi:hypothetical protein
MRPALPLAVVAALTASVALGNPVSTTSDPTIASDAVAGVATITIGAMRGPRDLQGLVPQVLVDGRWEPVRGAWVETGAELMAESGSGPMKYRPWGFAVPLRATPTEVRLAEAPRGFRWTGERLEPEQAGSTATPGEWRAHWQWRGRVELPARSGPRSTSSAAPGPRGVGAAALALGGLLLVTGAGRRRDARA